MSMNKKAAAVLQLINERRASLQEKRASAGLPKDPAEAGTVGTGAAVAKAPVETTSAPASGGPAKASPPPGSIEQSVETPKKPTADGNADEAKGEPSSKAAQIKTKVAAVGEVLRAGLKPAAAASAAAPAAPAAKSAGSDGAPTQITQDMFSKLAYIGVLAMEDEEAFARLHKRHMAKEGSAAAALFAQDAAVERDLLLKFAAEQEAWQEEQIKFAQAVEQQEAQYRQWLASLPAEKRASVHDRVVKLAAAHEQAKAAFEDPLEVLAYEKGAAEMAELMTGPDGEDADPLAGGLPGGSADMGPEQAAQILAQLVESGEITPEELEAIIAEYSAGGAGGEAPAGGDAPAAPEEAAAEAEAKEAAAILNEIAPPAQLPKA